MTKSKRVKFQAPIDTSPVDAPLQFKVRKDVEASKKIKEADVFIAPSVVKKNNKRVKVNKK